MVSVSREGLTLGVVYITTHADKIKIRRILGELCERIVLANFASLSYSLRWLCMTTSVSES